MRVSKEFGPVCGLAIAAYWATTLLVYEQNPVDFGHIPISDVLISLAGISAAAAALLVAGAFVSSGFGAGRLFRAAIIFGGSYLLVSGLLFPIATSPGMVDIADFGVSAVNLGLSTVIAAGVTVLLHTKARAAVAIGVGALLTSSLAGSAWALINREEERSSITELSRTRNIIVMSFDALQSDVMAQALQNFETKRLKDFTFFSNVLASSPATEASIAAEVSGNRNFKSVVTTQEELRDFARARSLPAALERNGWSIKAYGIYSSFLKGRLFDPRELGANALPTEHLYLLNLASSRSFGPYIRVPQSLVLTDVFLTNLPLDPDDLSSRLKNHAGADWDVGFLLTREHFLRYVDRLHVRTDRPVAHLFHFPFTHHPVDWDASCRYRSDDAEWHRTHQNVAGMLGEAQCALRYFERLLAKLDELGVYDNALIILKSDHGQTLGLNAKKDGLSSLPINGHPTFGFARHMPVLMIKKPGTRAGALSYDNRPFILDDLAYTLCMHAGTTECETYPGYDILDPEARPSGPYFINIPVDAQSTYKFDTHKTVELTRSARPLEQLRTLVQSQKEPLFLEGWSGDWNIARTSSLLLHFDGAPEQPIVLSLRAAAYVPGRVSSKKVLVSANGLPLGEMISSNNEEASFHFIVPTAARGSEGNLLIDFEVDATHVPAEHGESSDTRSLGFRLISVEILPAG